MKRLLGLLGVLAACGTVVSLAQEVTHGVMLAFGHIRMADGSYRDISGTLIPYSAERIVAQPISPLSAILFSHVPTGSTRQPRTLTNCYLADAGPTGYAVIDPTQFTDPSTLDDMQITTVGVGKPFQQLTCGMQIPDSHTFLIRWIMYSTYTPGLGAGVSAFSNVQADFGGFFSHAAGQWKVTFDISPYNFSTNTASLYTAQQFRSPNDPNGNGPFDDSIYSVFSVGADVNVGTSAETFYYDADENGIYDEQEIDAFTTDPPPPYGNLLFGLSVNANSDGVQPFSINLDRGVYVSGVLPDIWNSDDSYYIASPTPFYSQTLPPIREEIDGQAPTATATQIQFSLECANLSGANSVRVYFFNNATSTWDLIGTRSITGTDTAFAFTAATNPTNYIGPSRVVKTRVEWWPGGFGSTHQQFRVDRAAWVITH